MNYYEYPNPEREKVRPRNFFRRNLWAVISTGVAIVAILALFLVLTRPAASTNVTPQSSLKASSTTAPSTTTSNTTSNAAPTAAPTQAPAAAAGTVLCQYNTTTGFNNWINSSQWKSINDGTLGSDGTDNNGSGSNYIAWSGCSHFSTANYAVEAQIQFVRNVTTYHYNYEFGIMLRGDGNASGYEAGVGQDDCNSPTIAMISLVQNGQTGYPSQCTAGGPDPLGGSGSSQDYKIDTNWHTYRAEITGNTIRLFIDNTKLLETSDNTFTDAGQIGLRDVYGDINVKSFTVTAL
jgi:hypothetical protein